MQTKDNIYRLLRTGIYTSPLIGILSITPIFLHRDVPVSIFPKAFLIITLGTMAVWGVNIYLLYKSENVKSVKYTELVRYILSYFVSVILIIALMRMLRLGLYSQTYIPAREPGHFPYAASVLGITINSVVLIILNLILTREKQYVIEIENARLKTKNSEALNQQLKQQIHPHFLFNSLATLKSLIRKYPDDAEAYLVKLSDFLRISISAGKDNVGKLSDELKMCLDYLEMQKIRYGRALDYSVDISDEYFKAGFVPSFSLQLLAENAIKHNAMTSDSPLELNIKSEGGRIIVSNNLRKKIVSELSTGLGLINLSERYRILTGDEILIKNTGDHFSVSIKILSDEDNYHRG